MLIAPQLDSKVISVQIQIAEEMLRVARDELENERVQMAAAQAGELRAKALIECLERTDERRNVLCPFNSFRDRYLSVGFGGVQAQALEKHMDYLGVVISHARSKEGEVCRLEEMVALLEKDISQLKIVIGHEFSNFYHYFATKGIWWGQSALCNPSL
ncbi:hypothetical protein NLO83_25285 [Pseudomonas tremae]|uniref:hypothetical protein n=1 Tax=Pseudomonas syringae group TaxID=136849 RepID=UPI0001AF600D|nr:MULTISPECIES: hypothetical protein [Pseudomonas syringae group]MCQ3018884.1 hypothetical protein [Pseudomonas tremae]QGL57428.1 hypothetical protein POR16_14320 [Pseudomonas coronafaciens pv. oryzae str. 1_6]RMM31881.1 hypothetical protein ALQ80_02075 [Pseudomonas coronafaciens pv. oryzae]